MRPYRGKRKDNGEWAYGWYARIAHRHIIITDNSSINPGDRWWFRIEDFVEVLPSTVGQSTGIKDKNKKEIFGSIEINGKMSKGGDIVKVNNYQGPLTVKYEPLWMQYVLEKSVNDDYEIVGGQSEAAIWWDEVEVIGNATDNPELEEGGQ